MTAVASVIDANNVLVETGKTFTPGLAPRHRVASRQRYLEETDGRCQRQYVFFMAPAIFGVMNPPAALEGMPPREPQSADAVLMVRPAHFAFNPQTAASNSFQEATSANRQSRVVSTVQQAALREFDGLADGLRRKGVVVLVVEDTATPIKPDAIFPNNWVSFHRDGRVVLYPLLARNRRPERRDDVLLRVSGEGGFRAAQTVDLTYREGENKFLEGTGSVVLDRVHRVAYAGLSPRTDLDVLGEFSQRLDYELVTFDAVDAAKKPLYHTNVMLAIGSRFAVLCAESISDGRQRGAVENRLRGTGHEVLALSLEQMSRFAGNLLELAPPAGNVIALSQNAWDSLSPAQRRLIETHGSILVADIPTIERVGGGGVRCMLAEIHLPKRTTGVMA